MTNSAKDDPSNSTSRIYIMRVSIIDPDINASQWIDNLMSQCKNRRIYMEQPRAHQSYRERYPHHGVVADSDHPSF